MAFDVWWVVMAADRDPINCIIQSRSASTEKETFLCRIVAITEFKSFCCQVIPAVSDVVLIGLFDLLWDHKLLWVDLNSRYVQGGVSYSQNLLVIRTSQETFTSLPPDRKRLRNVFATDSEYASVIWGSLQTIMTSTMADNGKLKCDSMDSITENSSYIQRKRRSTQSHIRPTVSQGEVDLISRLSSVLLNGIFDRSPLLCRQRPSAQPIFFTQLMIEYSNGRD